ncbi:MAG TPA: MFS transporter [Segeticoccus sp.]|nr:MFS transporter [Segeticoccus sp.]
MSLATNATSVTRVLLLARVVNRLGGFGMGFLGLRLGRDLGVDLHLVGWLLAAFGACTIPSRILGGVVANRFGARLALVSGLLASAGAQAVIGLGRSVPVVVAGVLALGLAYEVVEPATQALVAEGVPSARRASSYALLWAAVSVAGVVAGALAALFVRWGVGALFLADATTSAAAAIVVAALLPTVASRGDRPRWRTVVSRPLLAWTGVGAVYATLLMVVVFMLPLAVEAGGHPPSLTGWLLATSAATALVTQRLVVRCEQRWSPSALLVSGDVALGLGLLLWAAGSVPALVAGAALEGASGALLLGTQQAVASRLAPPGGAATVMTVYGLSWGVGTVAAPLVGAPLLARGTGTLWLTCAVAAGILALAHLGRAVPRPLPRVT